QCGRQVQVPDGGAVEDAGATARVGGATQGSPPGRGHGAPIDGARGEPDGARPAFVVAGQVQRPALVVQPVYQVQRRAGEGAELAGAGPVGGTHRDDAAAVGLDGALQVEGAAGRPVGAGPDRAERPLDGDVRADSERAAPAGDGVVAVG